MEVRKQFLFDGKSSLDFGCYITGSDTFNSASKTQSKISVPGRNGDVIVLKLECTEPAKMICIIKSEN